MIPCVAGAGVRRARVKFWFIKNYMSPQMKRFLPAMAQRYGFEYSTVTYKWPSWLHKQAQCPLCSFSLSRLHNSPCLHAAVP